MHKVIIDGVRYIRDPARAPFKLYLIVKGERAPDAYAVRQSNIPMLGYEQFEVARDEAGNLSVVDVTHAP